MNLRLACESSGLAWFSPSPCIQSCMPGSWQGIPAQPWRFLIADTGLEETNVETVRVKSEQGSCSPLPCPLGSERPWILLGIGQLVLLKSTCQSLKTGLPVTCSGQWAKHTASRPHLNPVVSGMLSELSAVEAAVGVRASPLVGLSSIGECLVSVPTPICCSMLHLSDLQEQFSCRTAHGAYSCVTLCYTVCS